MCSSPASLSGVNLADLTEEQLTCGNLCVYIYLCCMYHSLVTDCIQECVHGVCDTSVGQCACDDGYTGENCSIGKPHIDPFTMG